MDLKKLPSIEEPDCETSLAFKEKPKQKTLTTNGSRNTKTNKNLIISKTGTQTTANSARKSMLGPKPDQYRSA